MIMRSVFFCATMALLLVLGSVAAPRALAQDPNRVAQLKVAVWPEYDQPSVLVILDGKLADTGNLPREISVAIPSSASLLVTTFENTDGSLAAEQPSKSADLGGGFTRVTYTVKTANFHVEYYDNLLRGSPDKTIDFVFKAAAPIDQVTLDFQQPLKATNYSVTPSAQRNRTENGFNYFTSDFPNVTAGQTLTAQVKYTKTDPNPSFLPTTAPVSVPPPSATAAPSSIWNNIFIIVGLVVLGLAAVLGFRILQQRSRPASRGMVSASNPSRRKARRESGGAVFCTQCGRDLDPEDNFCPKCGAKRRAA